MAVTPDVLQNLAKMADLRIEALNQPEWGGQPQVFQIRPTELLLSAAGDLIPTELVLRTAIPVKLEAAWGVEDVDGTPIGPDEAITHAGPTQKLLQSTVMVLPDFVELRKDQVPTTKTRYVTAKVTLTVTITDPLGNNPRDIFVEVPLPRFPITIPSIPVPTAAIFFHDHDLGISNGALASGHQFVLVVVPSDSVIAGISALRDACDTLRRLSKTASQLVQLAGFVANGLPSLTGLGLGLDTMLEAINVHKIGNQVGVTFVAADKIRDLNNVDMILGTVNDIEAEDEISSLVLLGPPGRRIIVYQHEGFDGKRALIEASPLCITLVKRLTSAPPDTEPPGMATQSSGPALNNRISSIAFI